MSLTVLSEFDAFAGEHNLGWGFDAEASGLDMWAGDKHLSLYIPFFDPDHGAGHFYTYLSTLSPPTTKVEQATTRLYSAAAIAMQGLVDILGEPYDYQFSTAIPSMIAWGNANGQKVFDWEVYENRPTRLVATATFSPR
jgi:hypothetical protein